MLEGLRSTQVGVCLLPSRQHNPVAAASLGGCCCQGVSAPASALRQSQPLPARLLPPSCLPGWPSCFSPQCVLLLSLTYCCAIGRVCLRHTHTDPVPPALHAEQPGATEVSWRSKSTTLGGIHHSHIIMHRDPILCLEQGHFSPLFQAPNTPQHASCPVPHLPVPTSGVSLGAVSSKVTQSGCVSLLSASRSQHTHTHPTPPTAGR